ncbi:beta-class carbonic anhydrase [Alicyclobacillus sp. ALC3]|uniref:beta-class carbonic anhydrase n=1 Tax=Alicyclobacillus sp. ALC3 TaxID=2796143 RepID=UPI0023798687|nr:carbonic anhydrase [Alicyclobacillus sp. ALC3]WDL96626.1 carbonic anhydrase [Alicyclobacillus sp. ALC3]
MKQEENSEAAKVRLGKEHKPNSYMYQEVGEKIVQRTNWALRRQKELPNNRRLFVLTCMDERVPIEQALGLEVGDAHVYRNAGGVVTDDVIRSAALSCNFFGSHEIIVVTHTECGMMSHFFHSGANMIMNYLEFHLGQKIDPGTIPLDPSLPELQLTGDVNRSFVKWIRMFRDTDAACLAQVQMLQDHPLIRKDVPVNGYVYEVESGALRLPYQRISDKVDTAQEMFAKGVWTNQPTTR